MPNVVAATTVTAIISAVDAGSKPAAAKPTTTKREAAPTTPRRSTKRKNRTESTVVEVPGSVRGSPEQSVSDLVDAITDGPEQPVPDILVADTRVPLDDYDSDHFISAFNRDCLFEPIAPDDVVGDEDTILFDEDIDEELNVSQEGEDDDSDTSDNDDFPFPVPVASGTVSGETLIVFDFDELAERGWETYDEHCSSGVFVDPALLYTGASGPNRAALAYAENPIAIFYFFLPTTFTKQLYSTIYQSVEMLQGYTFGVSRHCNGQCFHHTQDRDKNTREERDDLKDLVTEPLPQHKRNEQMR
ncbi:hypothetical protein PHMEG_00018302 [Phytophthora megakarya]|uniref:Uncharacterized protein n=1 Tax=Phytophthora megakarya TaxID=4795 RepID=A0A225VW72_9STRA|nr:hypothetical protein PHMEG_00018302 [Phytophthora megakarya]